MLNQRQLKPRWQLEDPLMPLAPQLASKIITRCQLTLENCGQLLIESGHYCGSNLTIDLHSDKGPASPSKSQANQDFALAWISAPNGSSATPRFAIVMADGLSSSRGAEWAAPVVCFTALDRLLAEYECGHQPLDSAAAAFGAAGTSLTSMVQIMAQDQTSCPVGEFVRTWQHILSKGSLLQSTLSIAWYDGDFFYSAVVGDGGIMLRPMGARSGDREIAKCDLSTSLVHPLKPGMSEREIARYDFTKTPVATTFSGLMCTDGIARGVDNGLSELLDDLQARSNGESQSVVPQFIEEAIRESPELFDDNLSMAVFHVTQERSP